MIEELPNELLEHILYNVDQDTLRLNCVAVCTKWKQIIHSVPFWKRYHNYWCSPSVLDPSSYPSSKTANINFIPEYMFDGDYEWALFSYINPHKNPYQRNLLKNPDGNLVSTNEFHMQENRYFEGQY